MLLFTLLNDTEEFCYMLVSFELHIHYRRRLFLKMSKFVEQHHSKLLHKEKGIIKKQEST